MKKILIVEDDKFMLNACRVRLQKAGFEVRTATNGKQAMEVLGEFIPDLILLDLILPIKDGFTVLEELKASEAYESIPVLITSSLGQKEDIERGMALGATDYIPKASLTLENLVAKVNSLLISSPKTNVIIST